MIARICRFFAFVAICAEFLVASALGMLVLRMLGLPFGIGSGFIALVVGAASFMLFVHAIRTLKAFANTRPRVCKSLT